MEETNTLWNTKMTDLTVGDNLKIAFIAPIMVVGGLAVAGMLTGAVSAVGRKFRKTKKVEAIEETTEDAK